MCCHIHSTIGKARAKYAETDQIFPVGRAAEQLLRGGGGKLHLTVRHITADSGFGEGVGLQAA